MNYSSPNVLWLFHWAVDNVPAYKDFLEDHHINHKDIISIDEFYENVPIMDKNNYLRKYDYLKLFPKNRVPEIISASSGSSGTPFFWPRGYIQEYEGGMIHYNIYREIFNLRGRTLVIVTFSMGNWIAGTFTMNSFRMVVKRGEDISIVTPGIDKDSIFQIVRDFASYFDNLIIAGYPPFVMDIIKEGLDNGLNWHNFNLKLLLAGENFSEIWRNKIYNLAGINNYYNGSVNIYGTADAAIIGHETPLTIFIRRKALIDQNFARDVWGNISYMPTLVQYYPFLKHIESVNGNIIFSAKSGIPLIRYNIKDRGDILTFKQIKQILLKYNYWNEVQNLGLNKWFAPFVVLKGRDDILLTFYAVNIYPENIKKGLENEEISELVSGKFFLEVEDIDEGINKKLNIHIELNNKKNISEIEKEKIKEVLFTNLCADNSEYRKLYSVLGKRAYPDFYFYEYKENPFFELKGNKHKWID